MQRMEPVGGRKRPHSNRLKLTFVSAVAAGSSVSYAGDSGTLAATATLLPSTAAHARIEGLHATRSENRKPQIHSRKPVI